MTGKIHVVDTVLTVKIEDCHHTNVACKMDVAGRSVEEAKGMDSIIVIPIREPSIRCGDCGLEFTYCGLCSVMIDGLVYHPLDNGKQVVH